MLAYLLPPFCATPSLSLKMLQELLGSVVLQSFLENIMFTKHQCCSASCFVCYDPQAPRCNGIPGAMVLSVVQRRQNQSYICESWRITSWTGNLKFSLTLLCAGRATGKASTPKQALA